MDKHNLQIRKEYRDIYDKPTAKGVLQMVCFTDDYVFWLENELNKLRIDTAIINTVNKLKEDKNIPTVNIISKPTKTE